MREKLHIVYASDDNFAEIMGISIISLLENNKNLNLDIYILDSGIKDENKKKVNSIFENYGRSEPFWIPAININEVLGITVKQDRGSISQFSRLFITRILPENIDKVLYFDCDIIVCQSIKELWNENLDGKIIGALKDPFSKYYRRNLGLRDNDILFNSGIMLIDVKKWIEYDVEKKILNLIKEYGGLIPQGDQGALGAILSTNTKPLNPKYNLITLFYDFSYKDMMIYRKPSKGYYSKIEIEEAKKNPVIIHFTTSFKSIRPWIKGSNHPYATEWLRYKQKSPWKDTPLRAYKKGNLYKEFYIKFEKIMPNYISLRISGLLQAYGRPWLIKIKYKL